MWLHYFPPFCLIFLSSEQVLSCHFTYRHGLLWEIWHADRICCPLPPCLVHGMLWHWLNLRRGWLCIRYFYIPNVSDVDLRTEMSCMCIICVGQSEGSLWFILLHLFWHYFEAWNRRSLGPSLPPTNNLESCDTYEEPVGSKAIPSKPLNYAYSGWCNFLIKDCRYSSDFTPQNTSELQQILSAGHISHNSPCLHVKWQDSEDPAHLTRGLSRMVGSSEVTLSPLNFMYIYV